MLARGAVVWMLMTGKLAAGTGWVKRIGARTGLCLDVVRTELATGESYTLQAPELSGSGIDCSPESECSWVDLDADKEYLYGFVQYGGCGDYLLGGIELYIADLQSGNTVRTVQFFGGSVDTNDIQVSVLNYNDIALGVVTVSPPRQIYKFSYYTESRRLIDEYRTYARDCDLGQRQTYGAFFGYCLDCDAGTYSTDGLSCEECPLGQYEASTGSSQCDACPSGFTTSATGATSSSQCESSGCDGGQYLYGTTCRDCPSGTYSVSGATCESCPIGRYQPNTGYETCFYCPLPETTLSTGAKSSAECVSTDEDDDGDSKPNVTLIGIVLAASLVGVLLVLWCCCKSRQDKAGAPLAPDHQPSVVVELPQLPASPDDLSTVVQDHDCA